LVKNYGTSQVFGVQCSQNKVHSMIHLTYLTYLTMKETKKFLCLGVRTAESREGRNGLNSGSAFKATPECNDSSVLKLCFFRCSADRDLLFVLIKEKVGVVKVSLFLEGSGIMKLCSHFTS
jgi:hypothetical protein